MLQESAGPSRPTATAGASLAGRARHLAQCLLLACLLLLLAVVAPAHGAMYSNAAGTFIDGPVFVPLLDVGLALHVGRLSNDVAAEITSLNARLQNATRQIDVLQTRVQQREANITGANGTDTAALVARLLALEARMDQAEALRNTTASTLGLDSSTGSVSSGGIIGSVTSWISAASSSLGLSATNGTQASGGWTATIQRFIDGISATLGLTLTGALSDAGAIEQLQANFTATQQQLANTTSQLHIAQQQILVDQNSLCDVITQLQAKGQYACNSNTATGCAACTLPLNSSPVPAAISNNNSNSTCELPIIGPLYTCSLTVISLVNQTSTCHNLTYQMWGGGGGGGQATLGSAGAVVGPAWFVAPADSDLRMYAGGGGGAADAAGGGGGSGYYGGGGGAMYTGGGGGSSAIMLNGALVAAAAGGNGGGYVGGGGTGTAGGTTWSVDATNGAQYAGGNGVVCSGCGDAMVYSGGSGGNGSLGGAAGSDGGGGGGYGSGGGACSTSGGSNGAEGGTYNGHPGGAGAGQGAGAYYLAGGSGGSIVLTWQSADSNCAL